MSLVTIWSPHFQSEVRMRGRSYQLAGRVQRRSPAEDELVRAEVRGRETYTVTVAQDGRHAVADCTCPHFARGAFCKHLWALLLDLQHNDEGPGIAPEKLAKLRVRSPKARKRDAALSKQRPREPEWSGRLSLLRSPLDRAAAGTALPAQRQVCYAILPRVSERHNGLVVELRQRTASATGWGGSKPLKLTQDALAALAGPVDRELCALILGAAQVSEHDGAEATRPERSHSTFRLPAGARRTMLRRMIDTGRCFVDLGDDGARPRETPVRWDGDRPWMLWLVGTQVEDQLVVNVQLRRDDQHMPIDDPQLILGGTDGLLIADGRAAPFNDRDAFRWVSQFRDDFRSEVDGAKPIHVPIADLRRFLDRLYMLPQLPEIDLPDGMGRRERSVEPTPHLDLFRSGSTEANEVLPGGAKNQLVAQVGFDYGDRRVNPSQPGRFVPSTPPPESGESSQPDDDEADHGAASLVRRDLRREREEVAALAALGFRQVASDTGDTLLLSAKQMPVAVDALLSRGWIVSADRRSVRPAGAPNLSVASGIDWFELRGGVTYQTAEGRRFEVTLPDILAAARAGKSMIELGDGSHGLLPEQWLAEHGLLTTLGRLEDDHLRFKQSQAAMLDALLDEKQLVHVDEPFERARRRLHEFEGIQPLEAATQFHGTLRLYQQDGLGWLAFLRWFGVGGILADDMGLGKTIQVLAMLQARYRENEGHAHEMCDVRSAMSDVGGSDQIEHRTSKIAHRPSLIVVPRSVVFNWVDEAARFTPDLRVLAYTGADRAELRDAFDEHDIIVTSYGLMRRDIEPLREHKFDYAVLDEAQAIKNPGSQSAKAARLLDAEHRLALTGTPIENHLGDLWSIFEFLNPGMLGASARFNELLRTPPGGARTAGNAAPGNGNGNNKKQVALQQVAAALRPFIFRRTKHQVLRDLPPKTEQTLLCEMEPEQRQVYDELRTYYHRSLMSQLDRQSNGRGVGKAAFMVLEALLRLRQAACHPGLIDDKRKDHPAAKLDVLLDRLGDIIDEGSKALVFSQFTSMLALVKPRLDERDIPYCYLDGKTRDRKQVVERFQTDEDIPVFLISLKTGGLGLNLTAAEYVFILDPWWNPAVEAQAIDRTHRIGQTKPVFAYRMICSDTVEQRIAELQAQKKELADAIVGGQETPLKDLTREDLEKLLS